MIKQFDYLRLLPEDKEEIKKIAEKEGRLIYRVIANMIETYKNQEGKNG